MPLNLIPAANRTEVVADFRTFFEETGSSDGVTEGCSLVLQVLQQADRSMLCHLAEVVSDLPAAVFDDGNTDRGEKLRADALEFVTVIAELMAGYGAA